MTPLAEMTCPHCGSPWMEGTGLFVCGEGTNGNVRGGCREYYTGKLIRNLYEQCGAMREALQGMVNEFRGELWEDDPIWLAAIDALGQRQAA